MKSSSGSKGPTKGKISPNKIPIDVPFDIHSEFTKAVQYHQSGQLYKAEEIYKRILETNPNHSDSLCLLGMIAHQANKNDIAITLINRAIQCNPKNPLYHNNLANALKVQGKLAEAIASYQKALEIKPDYTDAHYNLGVSFKDQGKLTEAINSYQKVLKIKPDFVEAYNNMGDVFIDLGKLTDAITCFQKALDIKPDFAKAHNNMGAVFKDRGELLEAAACFQKALDIKQDYAEALNNMGCVCQDQGDPDKAISYFQKALDIKQDYAEAYNNMGCVYQDQGSPDKAILYFQKALDIKPDLAKAYSELFHQLQLTCTWQKLEDMTAKLDALTKMELDRGIKTYESPFVDLARQAVPSRNFDIARSWGRDIDRAMSSLKVHYSFEGRRQDKTKKITVGYLSNDFRNHAMAHLTLSLYGLHNRDGFKVFCYSYGDDDGSSHRARIQQDCDKFVDIRDKGHADAARCIYEDQVDILVDLKGHTRGNRLEISALRPAPIQVRYLGPPNTTGADFFDYIITDRIAMPEDHAQYYSENFVYLPHCYQVNDHTQPISNKEWKKPDFGLPEEDSFVFCSFNQGYKIGPVMFSSWMKILRQVPKGVLWLQQGNEITEKNLRQEAESRGIKSTRLIFSGKLPKDRHLGRLRLADIALDTRIVNGIITTSDALWTGVPVITLQGNSFASRTSSSILTAIGLPELITQTLDEYESLAVDLAQDPGKLQMIRQKIVNNRLTGPLFDTPRFTKNLEHAYKEMWEIFVTGKGPRQINVVESLI